MKMDAEAVMRFARNPPDDVRVGLWEDEGLAGLPQDGGTFRLPF